MSARAWIAMIGVSGMVALGCNDDATAPDDPTSADIAPGALEVSVLVAGPKPDPDGYEVVLRVDEPLDVSTRSVGRRGGTVRFPDLPPGTHHVFLGPFAPNCSVVGGRMRSFTLRAGEEYEARFVLDCPAPDLAGLYDHVTAPGLRYVIDENGPFELQYYDVETGSVNSVYPGRFSVQDTEIVFDFRSSRRDDWQATGTLSGHCLTVEHSGDMLLSDIGENGEYCRPGGGPDEPDGSVTVTELTGGAAPDWSPDGQRIAFHRGGAIYFIDADGSNEVQLVQGTEPAWSPDGGRIAFEREEEVRVIDADGTNETALIPGGEPAWSPDGTKIVFTGSDGISVMNADGSGVTTLIRHDFRDDTNADWDMGVGRPAWSPDGARVAFEHLGDGDLWPAQIFVMNADGSDPRRPTATGGITYAESDPDWSLDGTRIVFWSYGYGIAIVDADGGEPTSVYHDFPTVAYGAKPDWSPDGSRIAFTARSSDDGPVILVARLH